MIISVLLPGPVFSIDGHFVCKSHYYYIYKIRNKSTMGLDFIYLLLLFLFSFCLLFFTFQSTIADFQVILDNSGRFAYSTTIEEGCLLCSSSKHRRLVCSAQLSSRLFADTYFQLYFEDIRQLAVGKGAFFCQVFL